jgi:AraC-like DNA-binding protein
MRALARLRRPFHNRARAAVTPPGSVTIRSGTADFVDAVTRGSSDVAVVDPILAERDRSIPDALSRAHLGTVLYILLTPEYAQASIDLIRELGIGEIVTYGYNDDPTTFADILRRQSRASRSQLLVTALTPQLTTLPPALYSRISHVSEEGHRIDSVEKLASVCGSTRWALARHFRSAGIASPSGFVAALTLLRNYDVLTDRSLTLLDVARAVGLSSERALRQQVASVSGLSIAELRRPLPIERFVESVVGVLVPRS